MSPGPTRPVLVFGHSHMVALQSAFMRRVGAGSLPQGAMAFFHLRRPDKLVCEGTGPERRPVAAFRARVEAFIRDHDAAAAFLVVGGNEQNAMSLFNRRRTSQRLPDFDLPGTEDGLDPDCERIPLDLYRAELRSRLEVEAFPFMRWVAPLLNAPVTVVGPPPPITDEAHLRAHPGAFEDRMMRLKLNSPRFRYKTWRLDSLLRRDLAAEIGAGFIAPPDSVRDGFGLAPRYRAEDPLHGNVEYGDVMLSLILETAAASLQESSP